MKTIGVTNYNLNFNGLVPKAKYSGSPNLSPKAIAGIEKMKSIIKQTEREILETETHLSNPDNSKSVSMLLQKRLELLSKYKNLMLREIEGVKQKRSFYDNRLESIQRKWGNARKRLEADFDKEYGNQDYSIIYRKEK